MKVLQYRTVQTQELVSEGIRSGKSQTVQTQELASEGITIQDCADT